MPNITIKKFISRLDEFTNKLESLAATLPSLQPSEDQYQTLYDLSQKLLSNATDLPLKIKALETKRKTPFSQRGEKLIAQARSEIKEHIANTKYQETFTNNIVYFFKGQSDLPSDSIASKARKQVTRERCERIRNLTHDGLISWAVAFKVSQWSANSMPKDTFSYILAHIEPDKPQIWPSNIHRVLRNLSTGPLQECQAYSEFLKAVKSVDPVASPGEQLANNQERAQSENQQRKRRCVDPVASPGEQLANNQVIVGGKAGPSQGVSNISSLLNYDIDSENSPPEVPQQLNGSPMTIQFDKDTLQQIVLSRHTDIHVWFCSLPEYPPFISLRLPKSLGNFVKQSGKEVYIPASSTNKTFFSGIYLVRTTCFTELIQRDGFGNIFWNNCGEEVFVTMQVIDEELVMEFVKECNTVRYKVPEVNNEE